MGHSYVATVVWTRDSDATGTRYSRAHRWLFDGGVEVPASASPLHVRPPLARTDAVDPEEAFVAALASCHMLFFLHFAATAGFAVAHYEDAATAEMGSSPDGAEYLARVRLRPAVRFEGGAEPDRSELEALHHRAHEACYLANSVRSEIVVEPA